MAASKTILCCTLVFLLLQCISISSGIDMPGGVPTGAPVPSAMPSGAPLPSGMPSLPPLPGNDNKTAIPVTTPKPV
ncbi:hypothetical protein AVEN_10998-1 [Araneus ventricosus]|uniref:Uncharacterized protein n=1 Tax=Araneus ventricosus TaxID=182803 RepID=A0A4Y2NW60_ARAVE|nr:hypothetical protein AVEN_10998-1 [Araneus ventricosus]